MDTSTALGGLLTLASVLLAALLLTPLLGRYIFAVMEGHRTWLTPIVGPFERLIYRAAGIDPTREQGWKSYAMSFGVFTLVSIVALYLLQRVQDLLPLNPTGAASVAPELAFNTAVSFATTTDWQNYAGETGVSYLTQMAGLTVQNFVAAAAGLAAAVAHRARPRVAPERGLGNFWVDMTRATLYVLLPIAVDRRDLPGRRRACPRRWPARRRSPRSRARPRRWLHRPHRHRRT